MVMHLLMVLNLNTRVTHAWQMVLALAFRLFLSLSSLSHIENRSILPPIFLISNILYCNNIVRLR